MAKPVSRNAPVVVQKVQNQKLSKESRHDLVWALGAYLLPLILTFLVHLNGGSVIVGEMQISQTFFGLSGIVLAGAVLYYYCFDVPSQSRLVVVGKMFVFIPAFVVSILPHAALLGWL